MHLPNQGVHIHIGRVDVIIERVILLRDEALIQKRHDIADISHGFLIAAMADHDKTARCDLLEQIINIAAIAFTKDHRWPKNNQRAIALFLPRPKDFFSLKFGAAIIVKRVDWRGFIGARFRKAINRNRSGENDFANILFGTNLSDIGRAIHIRALIKDATGFEGEFAFNADYPDGTPRKVLDVSKINGMGWTHHHDLAQGLNETYKWFLVNQAE